MTQATRRGRRIRPEEGFTLVELIISIMLLGIVFSVLSLGMLAAVRANSETTVRLDETRDEQFAAAYFAGDVAGATDMSPGTSVGCGPSGDVVAELSGESFDHAAPDPAAPSATTTQVSYVFGPAVAGVPGRTLTRYTCERTLPLLPDGTEDPRTGPRKTVVARNLTPTGATVACQDATGGAETCSKTTTSMTLELNRLSGGRSVLLSGTKRTTQPEAGAP